MPSPSENIAVVRGYLNTGNYAAGYNYIAAEIRGDQRWDQRLPAWFESAARIATCQVPGTQY
jgi:hypothetical protein